MQPCLLVHRLAAVFTVKRKWNLWDLFHKDMNPTYQSSTHMIQSPPQSPPSAYCQPGNEDVSIWIWRSNQTIACLQVVYCTLTTVKDTDLDSQFENIWFPLMEKKCQDYLYVNDLIQFFSVISSLLFINCLDFSRLLSSMVLL